MSTVLETGAPRATPAVTAVPADYLRVLDLGADGVRAVLDAAADVKARPGAWRGRLAGRSVVCLFDKPSTRTRVSTAVAAHRLGMLPVMLAGAESQMSRGETVEDTGRVLGSYADAIVVRTYEHARIERIAAVTDAPVVNALSDAHHPCQALADALTLREHFGRLAGLRVAYVGDANSNICHSLAEIAALTGMHLVIAAPPGYHPDPEVVTAARAAATAGGVITIVEDPEEAVRGADAVYPEIWVPMDKEHLRERRVPALSPYRVDTARLERGGEHTVLMHCLPAFRGQEVTSEALDGPRSVVWAQAANRLPTAQAVLHLVVARAWS